MPVESYYVGLGAVLDLLDWRFYVSIFLIRGREFCFRGWVLNWITCSLWSWEVAGSGRGGVEAQVQSVAVLAVGARNSLSMEQGKNLLAVRRLIVV